MSRKARAVTDIACALGSEYFEHWEFLTPEIRRWWEGQIANGNVTNCEGEGVMGMHCEGCSFCRTFETETVED